MSLSKVAYRASESEEKAASEPRALFIAVGFTLLVYFAARLAIAGLVAAPGLAPAGYAALLAAAAVFSGLRYDERATFARRFGRAAGVFLALYFLSEPFTIPPAGVGPGHPAVLLQHAGRWIGVALGVLAWRRPAALFAGAFTLWLLRDLNGAVTGFYFSILDIRNVAEVLAFVSVGICCVGMMQSNAKLRAFSGIDAATGERAMLIAIAIGVGGHLGNYFYSAIAKLLLDGGPLSWIFDNRLYDGMLGALERWTFPFAAWPAVTQAIYDAIKALNLPLHIFTFVAQFAAVIAILRRKWVMALTVVFDAFHLAVYFTMGLIFWKWICLNTVILATLAKITDEQWKSVRYAGLAAALAGAALFKTATLAWYDSPGFTSAFFEAETADGEWLRVPPAYFNSASYQVSQARLYAPSAPGFNFSIWGSVLHKADADAGRACQPPEGDALPPEKYGPLDRLAAYVWLNQDIAAAKAGPDGRRNYYLYMHHHMPSLFVRQPFDDADKRAIKGYRYVVESVCLGLENGRLKRDVIARSEFPLPRPEALEAR
ncbi:MAG TPA: hypothetical protein PLV61_10875 [Parvularculaceae bacterium]|nr:hypothetical protein [Caulobacterales bacterium]HPE31684.1 hypothetical protein [Parvularculaceae bacterium]HRX39888.1 hypothetical protein [Parvularculaceae bacterium]